MNNMMIQSYSHNTLFIQNMHMKPASKAPTMHADREVMEDVSNLQVQIRTSDNAATKIPSKPESVQKINPRKKRHTDAFPDNGNDDTHKVVVLTIEQIRVRRQQMKVIEAMKSYHSSVQSVSKLGDSCIQTLITDYMKPKSELTERKLTDLEAAQLLVNPDQFQEEGVLDERTFHFANTLEEFEDVIAYEQEKANQNIQRKLYFSEKKPLLRMPNLVKCGLMRCAGCGNLMIHCHDVVYGPFCVYEVVKYCRDTGNTLSDTSVKKVFLDTYNRCLAFLTFREKNKKPHDHWVFPPLCVQDNSYSYALFWYEWIVEGLWVFRGDSNVNEDDEDDSDKEDSDYEE